MPPTTGGTTPAGPPTTPVGPRVPVPQSPTPDGSHPMPPSGGSLPAAPSNLSASPTSGSSTTSPAAGVVPNSINPVSSDGPATTTIIAEVSSSVTTHSGRATTPKQAFVPSNVAFTPVTSAVRVAPASQPVAQPAAAELVGLEAAAPSDVSLGFPSVDSNVALAGDFSQLADDLGALVGVPLETERAFPDTCDTTQLTSTGLAYLDCSTGHVGFAALPDGLHHWALADGQLLEWIGPELEPPWTAGPADLVTCDDPSVTYCRLAADTPVGGYLPAPGATNSYQVMLRDASTRLVVSLTDLPADYDLYLVDGTGAIIAQSVQEGTAPETIDQVLPAGTYMVYVHVDPARAVAPDDAYRLRLSESSPGIVEAPPSEDEPVVGNVIVP